MYLDLWLPDIGVAVELKYYTRKLEFEHNGESFALLLLAGAKWSTYVGLIGLTGAVAVRCLTATAVGEVRDDAVERRLGVFVAGSAAIFLVGTAARLYAQTWSVFGLDEPVTLELVRVVGIDSRWGGRWQPQAGFALLATVAVAPATG